MKNFFDNNYFSINLGSVKKESEKKIISFSVYGEDRKYSIGAIKNVEWAKKYFPDWICRFYCSEKANDLEELAETDSEVLIVESDIPPMYWRFFSIDDPDVSYMISRDTDSLMNPRDYAAVKEWLDSGKTMHLMHDCPSGHYSPVMGGMWGIKSPLHFSMTEKIFSFCERKNFRFRYSQDQTFLTEQILPIFKNDSIDHHFKPEKSHSSHAVPWPKHEEMEIGSFVGERISFSALEIKDLKNKNPDSKKLFVMNHQGKADFNKVKDIIIELADKNEEVVLPCKKGVFSHLKKIFSKCSNIKYEEIDSDIGGSLVYKDKFHKTHRFIGFGNHGEKINGKKGFNPEKCRLQAGLSLEPNKEKDNTKNKALFQSPRELSKKLSSESETPKKSYLDDMPLVTAVIGTFNRWEFLSKAIESVKNQTYKNLEIIVVNDGSTDEDYSNNIPDGVLWVNLPKNSEIIHGFRCRSYTYNYGIKIARGEYIAFLDDDDAWYPTKIEKQIIAMQKTKSEMSCTEAVQGRGLFDPEKDYNIYMKGMQKRFDKWNVKEKILNSKGYSYNNVPSLWTKEILSIHNFCIGSSVVLKKSLFDKVGLMNETKRYKKGQDYELWKRVLSVTDCAFVNEPLTYYDHGHGNGRQY